jgi:hypothetical protein
LRGVEFTLAKGTAEGGFKGEWLCSIEIGPNKRSPIWLFPDHRSPPGTIVNTGIYAVRQGY